MGDRYSAERTYGDDADSAFQRKPSPGRQDRPGLDPRSAWRRRGRDHHVSGVLGARGPQPDGGHTQKLAAILGVAPGDLLDISQSEWGQIEWRVTNGLEQKEVAAALGVSPTTLSAVEATYTPAPDWHASTVGGALWHDGS